MVIKAHYRFVGLKIHVSNTHIMWVVNDDTDDACFQLTYFNYRDTISCISKWPTHHIYTCFSSIMPHLHQPYICQYFRLYHIIFPIAGLFHTYNIAIPKKMQQQIQTLNLFDRFGACCIIDSMPMMVGWIHLWFP